MRPTPGTSPKDVVIRSENGRLYGRFTTAELLEEARARCAEQYPGEDLSNLKLAEKT